MVVRTHKKWVDTLDAELLRDHRVFNSPYGYLVGVLSWPVFFSVLSIWAVVLQSSPPPVVATVGGLAIGVGCFVVTSLGSALVMGVTAWNTPQKHIRREFALLVLSVPLAALLFGFYLTWPTVPYWRELGVTAFVAHELSKIVFLGPALGFAFVVSPLTILAYRTQIE